MASAVSETSNFQDMCLDDRILAALNRLKWSRPTLIQEKAIPLVLDDENILARARTGSGKTAAFAIPIIHRILRRKQRQTAETCGTSVLVLAPTKELCHQIKKMFSELTILCSNEITHVEVTGGTDPEGQKPLLQNKPDVVVGTPARVLMHLEAGNLKLKHTLNTLVIDEADLLFSFGYEQDIRKVLTFMPSDYQTILMSATLSADVHVLKQLMLDNPVILKLQEPEIPESNKLMQYLIKCEEEDKFVLIYALFKLKLIRGKTLIFTNSINQCYRLKLYFEQFGIASCILNSELPAKSRAHAVSQFNKGIYDIIIASDEKSNEDILKKSIKVGSRKVKRDKEFSMSRGIDFQFVSTVINLDFPTSVEAYIHRVGRTARGNNDGAALSFVSVKEMPYLQEVENYFTDSVTGKCNIHLKPYTFKMDELEGFRYRARDAFRAVTKIAVREARLKEIKIELLNSRKLKAYFEDNPRDLQILKHDKPLHIVKLHSHLKNVPDYIVPNSLKPALKQMNKGKPPKRKELRKQQESKAQKRFKRKQKDPLQSFQFEGVATALASKANKKLKKEK